MLITTQSTTSNFTFLVCNTVDTQYNSIYKNPIQMHSFTSDSDLHALAKVLFCEGTAVSLQLSLYSVSHGK